MHAGQTQTPDVRERMFTHIAVSVLVQRNATLSVTRLILNHVAVTVGWRITGGMVPDENSEIPTWFARSFFVANLSKVKQIGMWSLPQVTTCQYGHGPYEAHIETGKRKIQNTWL